jgi:hypothetical protein
MHWIKRPNIRGDRLEKGGKGKEKKDFRPFFQINPNQIFIIFYQWI